MSLFITFSVTFFAILLVNIIQFDDIQKGVTAYSNDLIVETSVELRDVFPSAENLIYQFIGEEADLFDTDLSRLYRNASIPEEQHTRTTDFLLWYGVLGVVRLNNLASYIHDVGYDMQKLTTIRQKEGGDCPIYRINAAYWSGLGISLSDKQQTETNAKAV